MAYGPEQLKKVLSFYKYDVLGAAGRFVKKIASCKDIFEKIVASITVVAPENFTKENVWNHYRYRYPCTQTDQVSYVAMEHYLGFSKNKIKRKRKAVAYAQPEKMQYGILGKTPIFNRNGKTQKVWFLHTWPCDADITLQIIATAANWLNQTKKRSIVIRVGEDFYGDSKDSRNDWGAKLKAFMALSSSKNFEVRMVTKKNTVGWNSSGLEIILERNNDVFGKPEFLFEEHHTPYPRNSLLLIVNRWNSKSYIGNGGSLNNTMDGWCVAAGSKTFPESFGNPLGTFFINACFLHNCEFNLCKDSSHVRFLRCKPSLVKECSPISPPKSVNNFKSLRLPQKLPDFKSLKLPQKPQKFKTPGVPTEPVAEKQLSIPNQEDLDAMDFKSLKLPQKPQKFKTPGVPTEPVAEKQLSIPNQEDLDAIANELQAEQNEKMAQQEARKLQNIAMQDWRNRKSERMAQQEAIKLQNISRPDRRNRINSANIQVPDASDLSEEQLPVPDPAMEQLQEDLDYIAKEQLEEEILDAIPEEQLEEEMRLRQLKAQQIEIMEKREARKLQKGNYTKKVQLRQTNFIDNVKARREQDMRNRIKGSYIQEPEPMEVLESQEPEPIDIDQGAEPIDIDKEPEEPISAFDAIKIAIEEYKNFEYPKKLSEKESMEMYAIYVGGEAAREAGNSVHITEIAVPFSKTSTDLLSHCSDGNVTYKNSNIRQIECGGAGDCFFYTLAYALSLVGVQKDVMQLRRELSFFIYYYQTEKHRRNSTQTKSDNLIYDEIDFNIQEFLLDKENFKDDRLSLLKKLHEVNNEIKADLEADSDQRFRDIINTDYFEKIEIYSNLIAQRGFWISETFIQYAALYITTLTVGPIVNGLIILACNGNTPYITDNPANKLANKFLFINKGNSHYVLGKYGSGETKENYMFASDGNWQGVNLKLQK